MRKDLPVPSSSVAVVSDIHGDERALQRVLERVRDLGVGGGLLVCGDLLFSYREDVDPVAALDLLLEERIVGAVAGNTDRWFVDEGVAAQERLREPERRLRDRLLAVRRRLAPRHLDFLASLPHSIALELWGRRVLATHASPLAKELGLTLDLGPEELKERLAGVDADFLVTGHLHRTFTRVLGGLTHFAVGAVSRHPHESPSGPEFAIVGPSGEGLMFVPQCLGPC